MKTTDEQLENLCVHVLTSMGRSSLLYQALEELRELRRPDPELRAEDACKLGTQQANLSRDPRVPRKMVSVFGEGMDDDITDCANKEGRY